MASSRWPHSRPPNVNDLKVSPASVFQLYTSMILSEIIRLDVAGMLCLSSSIPYGDSVEFMNRTDKLKGSA